MALISADDEKTLRALFAQRLQSDVTLTFFTQEASPLAVPSMECHFCTETRQILAEVAALDAHLHLEVKDFIRDGGEAQRLGVTRIPAVVLRGQAQGRVRHFGIPSGYEFATLIEDLLAISTGTTDLSAATRSALAGVDRDVHLQVFVTPTCPYCPAAAVMAHQFAVENPHITADVIEVTEFPDMAHRYNVQGVPKTVINERVEMAGAVPEADFFREVLRALEPAGAGARSAKG